MIKKEIVKIAKDYIGEKEISNNQGFLNKKFEEEMKSVGFEKGHSWCSYFAELVWTKAYRKFDKLELVSIIRNAFSANAVKTSSHFIAKGFLFDKNAEIGSLAIWMKYKDGKPVELSPGWYAGHIGIVSEVSFTGFKTIEGNTDAKGGREGIEVAEKARQFSWGSNSGLRLTGFVHPKEV